MAYADCTYELEISGTYDVHFIVPTTSNAHVNAAYIIMIDGYPQDTVDVNQNEVSGSYVSIVEFDLPSNVPVKIRVQNNGGSSTNTVLRADAIKLILTEEKFVSSINEAGIPEAFELYQNYPNPFNPSTRIAFALPEQGTVQVDFFDLQGRKVDRTLTLDLNAGYHFVDWQPQELSSGLYLYRVNAPGGSAINKCMYIK